MISKVFNWVGGGFFRTIGRFIAFALLGYLLVSLFDLDDFKISELFFDKVSASTNKYSAWYGNSCNNCISRGSYVGRAWYGQYNVGDQNYSQELIFTSATNLTDRYNAGAREIIIGVNYANDDYGWWESDAQATTNQLNDFELPSKSYTIQALYSNNGNSYNLTQFCQLVSDDETFKTISCPLIANYGYFMGIRLIYQGSIGASSDTSQFFGYNRNFTLVYDNNSQIIEQQQQTTDAITNQTQQQQQQHQEIMNTNSTQTEESANSFFGSFSDNDHGGLSSIITAPLVMVNKMLDGQCVQPSATWKGATISLPCGDMFWGRQGASDLKNLLNIFYGGFICYYAIRKLFLMIESLKDPTQDRIEVTDL